MGLGFGPWGPFSPFAPFGGFGYYGFGVPFTSYSGIGFYNSYTAFGPYRRFGGYYPLGGFSTAITAPVLASPLVVAPVSRPTYVQQSNSSRPAAAPIQKNNYWYYCRNPEGYYPYVKECSGEWIKVPQQPS